MDGGLRTVESRKWTECVVREKKIWYEQSRETKRGKKKWDGLIKARMDRVKKGEMNGIDKVERGKKIWGGLSVERSEGASCKERV